MRPNNEPTAVIQTLEDALRGFVEALNETLRGEGPMRNDAAPQLDIERVMADVFTALPSGVELSLELDADHLEAMIDAMVEWASRTHRTAFTVPLFCEDDADLETIGQTLFNCAIAGQGEDVTPREFLRTPEVIGYLYALLVAIACACTDACKIEEAEEEQAYWDQGIGAIMADAPMRVAFLSSLALHVADQEDFMHAFRRRLVAKMGDVRLSSLKRLITKAEQDLAMVGQPVGRGSWAATSSGEGGLS